MGVEDLGRLDLVLILVASGVGSLGMKVVVLLHMWNPKSEILLIEKTWEVDILVKYYFIHHVVPYNLLGKYRR